jgi:hypothetical protein
MCAQGGKLSVCRGNTGLGPLTGRKIVKISHKESCIEIFFSKAILVSFAKQSSFLGKKKPQLITGAFS